MQTPSPYRRDEIESANSIQESIQREQSRERDYSRGGQSADSQEYESQEYFESRDISPVQHRQYESSLETIRSEEETGRKSNMDIIINFPSGSGLKSSHYQDSRPSVSQYSRQSVSQHSRPSVSQYSQKQDYQVIEEERREESPEPRFTAEYCATVESIE